MKNRLISLSIIIIAFLFLILQDSYSQEVFRKGGQLYVNYKGKQYELKQYVDSIDVFKYYSLQYRPLKGQDLPEEFGLVLIMDREGKVIKEITNTEYCPEIITYYLDNNKGFQDLILLWNAGAHSQTVEVWKNNKNKDFVKVFEQFSDKNIRFLVKDGVPALAFKKEYPMSALNDNFSDKAWDFYKWNGKTFK